MGALFIYGDQEYGRTLASRLQSVISAPGLVINPLSTALSNLLKCKRNHIIY